MSKRNPSNNAILQAMLDASDTGYGTMTIDQFITKLSSDARLRKAMQAKWNGHSYPEKSMVYTQLTIEQRIFSLSDPAFKLISLLGSYCHQNGLIQVRKQDAMATLKVSESTVKRALSELITCGALRIALPSVQHSAPIYAVNPALLNKGTRRKADEITFASKLNISPGNYILNQELPLQARIETIYIPEKPPYNKLSLLPSQKEQKKGPAAATTADPRSDKSVNPRPHHRTRAQKQSSAEQDGQMSIYDWLGEVDS